MKRNLHLLLAPVLVLVLGLGGCAHERLQRAMLHFGDISGRFHGADINGDEALSLDEAQAGMQIVVPVFADIDTDDNQRVNENELRSYLEWQRVLAAGNTRRTFPR